MKRLLVVFFLAMGLMLAAPSTAPAPVYYIGAGGNDANDGLDADKQWLTIEKAMETVAAGDKVWVKNDKTYIDQDDATGAIGQLITKGASGSSIDFQGYISTTGTFIGDGTFACTVLDAGSGGLTNALNDGALSGSTYYSFKFFRFTGGSADGVNFDSIARVNFESCRFDNNGEDGIDIQSEGAFSLCQFDNNAGDGAEGSEVYVNCVAFANTATGISPTGGYAIGCKANNNGAVGLSYGGSSGPAGAYNCVVDGGGTDSGISGVVRGFVINSILFDTIIGISASAGNNDANISKNNLFFSNDTDVSNWPTDPSDIAADPQFVDADANDYRLSDASPARQAGIDVGSIDGITTTSFIDVGAQQAEAVGGAVQLIGGGLVR